MTQPYIGQIQSFGFNWAPKNWALCSGQLLPVAQNTALFSLLGTTFGGNGQTTFGLPNTQSRTMVHQGQGPGLNSYVMGEAIGAQQATLNITNLPQHNHLVNASGTAASATNPSSHFYGLANGVDDGSGNAVDVQIYAPPGPSTMQPTSTMGGSQPVSILQPFNTVNNSIALFGIYPSRN